MSFGMTLPLLAINAWLEGLEDEGLVVLGASRER